jgi:hypothetical protein
MAMRGLDFAAYDVNVSMGVFSESIVKALRTHIQSVTESCTDILTTSYWLHVELGKNI